MPTTVAAILKFKKVINFMVNRVEHEKKILAMAPDRIVPYL